MFYLVVTEITDFYLLVLDLTSLYFNWANFMPGIAADLDCTELVQHTTLTFASYKYMCRVSITSKGMEKKSYLLFNKTPLFKKFPVFL